MLADLLKKRGSWTLDLRRSTVPNWPPYWRVDMRGLLIEADALVDDACDSRERATTQQQLGCRRTSRSGNKSATQAWWPTDIRSLCRRHGVNQGSRTHVTEKRMETLKTLILRCVCSSHSCSRRSRSPHSACQKCFLSCQQGTYAAVTDVPARMLDSSHQRRTGADCQYFAIENLL